MTDLNKALESFGRAANEARTGLMKASLIPRPFITLPPPSDGYEPLYIPDWWHEEYLKSLEPEPPFDLDRFLLVRFDDIAVGFANIADRLSRSHLPSILAGAFFGSIVLFGLSGYWEAIPLGACVGGLAGFQSDKHSQTQENQ